MLKITRTFLLTCFFIFNYSLSFANTSIAIIDLDYLIENSKLGKSILININQLDEKNISVLKKKNEQLIKLESEIKSKQNIISESAYKEEIEKLKVKANQFRIEKNQMAKDFNQYKKKEISIFFDKIAPIINQYMTENSIEILLDKKKIFMGKSNTDITKIILNVINNLEN